MLLQLVLVGAATLGATYYRATMDYRKLKPHLKKREIQFFILMKFK